MVHTNEIAARDAVFAADPVPDWARIRHLLRIGFAAALIVLTGDMLLGWGTADPSLSGMEQYFSRYQTVSAARVVWSALLGMIGIPLECMSYFGIYRLIASRNIKLAHAYRAGVIGMLIFGAFVHVMCCAVVFFYQSLSAVSPETAAAQVVRFAAAFQLPASGMLFVFFLLMAAVQICAFARGKACYPRWCWIFSVLFGIADVLLMRCCGNRAFAYALSTGWISIGNLWMFGGLLLTASRAQASAADSFS